MPPLPPFKLERYFARYEFKVKYLLSPSDCESLTLPELLQLADPESRQLWNSLSLGYTESPGHPALRAEIARLYQTISPEQIVVAAPEELIYIAMHTLLNPGDHVICIAPAYQSLAEIARSLSCSLTPWAVTAVPPRSPHSRADEDGGMTGGWRLPLESLAQSITDRTRLLIINFPHNPTGYLPARAELEAILQLAGRHNLYVFSDEMYRLLEYEPETRLPPVADLYARGISLSGLSKTFALPGLRLGWLATPEPGLPEKWLTFKDYTTICNSAPGEILGLMALRAADKIIARNLQIVKGNLRLAEQFFAGHPNWLEWLKPQAGSVAFPRWLGSPSIEEVCQDIVDQRGVMIVPGSLFDYTGSHFRLGLGRRNLPEALAQLDDYLRSR